MVAVTQKEKSKSFSVKDLPRKNWSVQTLAHYCQQQHAEIVKQKQRVALHVYRLGQALIWAKEKIKHGEWEKWLKNNGISSATASRAVALVERAGGAEEVERIGIVEAYIKYGILRPEYPKIGAMWQPPEPSQPSQPSQPHTIGALTSERPNLPAPMQKEHEQPQPTKPTATPVPRPLKKEQHEDEPPPQKPITKKEYQLLISFVNRVGGWARAIFIVEEGRRTWQEHKI